FDDGRSASLGSDRVTAHRKHLGNHSNAKFWVRLAELNRGPQPCAPAADDQNVVLVALHLVNLKSRITSQKTVVILPSIQSIAFSEYSRLVSSDCRPENGPRGRSCATKERIEPAARLSPWSRRKRHSIGSYPFLRPQKTVV